MEAEKSQGCSYLKCEFMKASENSTKSGEGKTRKSPFQQVTKFGHRLVIESKEKLIKDAAVIYGPIQSH